MSILDAIRRCASRLAAPFRWFSRPTEALEVRAYHDGTGFRWAQATLPDGRVVPVAIEPDGTFYVEWWVKQT